MYTTAEIVKVDGYPGNFRTVIKVDGDEVEVVHGAAVIATGGEEVKPGEYLYGQRPDVVTQLELERMLDGGSLTDRKKIVMIQCVGSREAGRRYCSRICCTHALKNALKIKELNPGADIMVLYRDMRSYGFKERHYRAARDQGVIFIRYEPDDKPEVSEDGSDRLVVRFTEPALGRKMVYPPDLLVLSTGVAPGRDNETLSRLFKVPLNADGFFAEAHLKLRPVDFAADGLYLCGLAHSPRLLEEAAAQACAASMRAAVLLAKNNLESLGIVATVDEEICRGCGICLDICPYNARELNPITKVAKVNAVLCQGCGACVASCPSGASQQKNFEKEQILAMLQYGKNPA